jgi:hypothetical protein
LDSIFSADRRPDDLFNATRTRGNYVMTGGIFVRAFGWESKLDRGACKQPDADYKDRASKQVEDLIIFHPQKNANTQECQYKIHQPNVLAIFLERKKSSGHAPLESA